MRLEFYRRKDGDWSWRLKAANNRIVAVAGEGYTNLADCVNMAATVIDKEILIVDEEEA